MKAAAVLRVAKKTVKARTVCLIAFTPAVIDRFYSAGQPCRAPCIGRGDRGYPFAFYS